MSPRVSEALGAVVTAVVALAAAAIMVLSLTSCDAKQEYAWPESTEFSTLETGQDRFSVHDTNLYSWMVIVDHQTGVEYLYRYKYGMTPLLDADGSPLRVAEAD